LKLHALSCLEAADVMTGHQFEVYYAQLLESLGWTRIRVTGDKPGGDGGDILATDPRNRDFAIQCKRYAPAKAFAIGDVRELNGALAHEHPNRLGMIVTTSRLTPPAAQLAARTGIQVVARPALASQMARVRDVADPRSGRAASAAPAAELP
jgi:restriction system protein